MKRILHLFGLAVLALGLAAAQAADLPKAVLVPERAAGTAVIAPETSVSGEYGTWTVTFTVGAGGIATGGGIRVQLPDSFHSGQRNSANSLQSTRPKADHYVTSHTGAPGVTLATEVEFERNEELIKQAKPSLDGRSERYVFVARVVVKEGSLKAGDRVSVVYGDTSGGSAGMLGGAIAFAPEPVLVAVDAKGDGKFGLIETFPQVGCQPGKTVEVLAHAPSWGVVGKPSQILVSVLDKQFNAAHEAARFAVSLVTGQGEFPAQVEIPAGAGHTRFTVTPLTTAPFRLRVTETSSGLSAISNPVDVTRREPAMKLYWGDLHSHTRFSWDGVGDDSFGYARNVTGLDFYAMTDHSMFAGEGPTRGLGAHNFAAYGKPTDAANAPGSFVTLHAYECSFGRPYGHHIVYFRDQPTILMYPNANTLEELWQALSDGNALTIPHHTGKFPGGVDFGYHDPRFRRNFEIYSGHGLSEVYNPGHPLSFEHSQFTSDARSLKSPTFAQDVWIRGLMLSTIASSDDHRAQPGQPHYGMVALRAPELTRDAVFQSLYDRHTYGTSGVKMVLELRVNGGPMGQTVTAGALPPEISLRALGTSPLLRVELLRRQEGDGEQFVVVRTWEPNAWDFSATHRDLAAKNNAIYYARVIQQEPVRGKLAEGWTSPVWLQLAD